MKHNLAEWPTRSFRAPETIELAERLASLLPAPLSMSIFLNTGSEANEIALKMAKLCTGRFETVGLTRSPSLDDDAGGDRPGA